MTVFINLSDNRRGWRAAGAFPHYYGTGFGLPVITEPVLGLAKDKT
jgi:hypothetical protein